MKLNFLIFFVLGFLSLGAQETTVDIQYSNTPLSTVLSELESVYDVKFSYNSETIRDISVSIDLTAAKLPEVLNVLQKQTRFVFEQIDERYYIVKSNTKISVCGFLKDVEGNLIEGGSIGTKLGSIGTISDLKGFFELKDISISDTLSMTYLGFKPIVLPVKNLGSEDCETFIMSPENFLLNEVVVLEYLAAGILKNRDGSVKITPNNLEILSGLSEPDVLQNTQLLPGIDSPSETASGLFIRGGTPDQNLILWDGIKMYNSDHFFGMLSAFNPYIVKEVKVYRSGTKVEYGDRVSGVIDIKTDTNIPQKTGGGFGLNLTHADFFIKTSLSEQVGIQVSARRSLTDIFSSPTFNQFTQKVFQNTSILQNQDVFEPEFTDSKELFQFTDFTLKVIAQPSTKDKISVSNIYTKNKLDYTYEDTEFIDASSDRLNVSNFGSSLQWQSDWSSVFSTKFQAYYSAYDFEYRGTDQFINEEQSVIKKNNIEEHSFAFQADWVVSPKVTFSNGYQYFNNRVGYTLEESLFVESDLVNNPTHAIYNQLNYQPENWFIDIGLRTNYYTQLSSAYFEPRLYVEHSIDKALRIKASAEIKNQSVSQIIEFTTQDFGLENQVWVLTDNDEIPLLRSNQFSGGILWNKDDLNLDVDIYHKNINGLTSLTRGFESTDSNFTKGKSITIGVDFLVKKKVGNYATWLGYTYSRTSFDFEELNNGNPFRGNNDITHSLTWSHFYKWDNFQFSLGWKYRTGIPYTGTLGTIGSGEDIEINYANINAETLPDYHRLDFSFLYDFELSKKENPVTAKLGFSLLNLYGRQNLLSKNYDLFDVTDDQDNVTIELQEITKYSLGFTPNVVFRLRF